MTHIWIHPFKEGVYGLLRKHFDDPIVKKFILEFEVNIYNPKEEESVWKQKKTNNLVLEVKYKTGEDTAEFICDLYSWETKAQTEARLLRAITEKVRAGVIGKDWSVVSKKGESKDGASD